MLPPDRERSSYRQRRIGEAMHGARDRLVRRDRTGQKSKRRSRDCRLTLIKPSSRPFIGGRGRIRWFLAGEKRGRSGEWPSRFLVDDYR